VSAEPPPVPGGRTAEEREAARREREARRAASKGKGKAPPPRRQAGSSQAGDRLARARELINRSDGADPQGSADGNPGGGNSPRGESDKGDRGRRPSGSRRARWPVAIVGGLLALLAAWFLLSLLQPFKGDGGNGRVQVVVPKGAGVGDIGDLLERRGVVASSFFFQARARLDGRAGDLKPGSYQLRHDMSYAAALEVLAKGPRPDIVSITVPEGRSRREVAAIVGDSLTGSYLAATRRSARLSPRRYGALHARDLEGFLFPATYELKRGRPVSTFVEQQLAAFKQRFATVSLRYARSKNLTPYDVLIIGSMVEREAQLPRERALIASVIYNRLHARMPLQIDATIRFATNNWKRPIRRSELESRSPYNTYRRPGLPLGPIGSPGLASIQAAARPRRSRYLYYVVKPCGNGAHAFARTDAEFERLKARYERARQGRGGRSPVKC
jgi:peptidoglycan lytic transglycosylase G